MLVVESKQLRRKTGIDVLGDVPWGTHLCLFYKTKEDLIDILLPYFKTGLENNEFCIWVASEPLNVKEAEEALRTSVPDFAQYLRKGQVRIISDSEWYLKHGVFDTQRILDAWVNELNQALASGFAGMRVTGNGSGFEKKVWRELADYEKEVNKVIGKYRMIAICSYCINECGATEIVDMVNCHQSAIIGREGKWEIIESSERKQVEDKLRESEKSASKGQLAAQIAHEINNPLAGIKNSFLLIKDAIPEDHPYYRYVGLIDKEIERISDIVRQMFDLYRPNKTAANEFLVDETIHEVIHLLEVSCREHNVVITINRRKGKAAVKLPEALLRQALFNIVKNAVEASPPGEEVKIAASVTKDVLTLTVSDHGSGIPEQAQSRVFEPSFTTKDGQTTGLGIGLSVSRNIIEGMGGSIHFESKADKRTVFSIVIPLS